MIVQSILEVQDLLIDLDRRISKSDYKTERVIKELGIAPATYYRKLRDKKFDINELAKIIQLLYPSEYEKLYIKKRLTISLEQAENGMVSTTEEVMKRYQEKYMKK
ncbi:MAG: hypothetical protein E6Q66_03665 [Pedobacter sp.]|jgi:hypothetical protein|nr:MAG: hypothetical protein E6Q66_03665 [Pedobacter sp.]